MIKESKYAIIEYDECDKNLIDDLINTLDENYNRIKDFFDKDLVLHKIKINIFSTKKEYDEKVGIKMFDGEVPSWVIGSYSEGMINYVSFNDFKNTSHQNDSYESYLKTLIHEFIHFITYEYSKKNNCEYPIKCISEGIAYYLSGQGDKIEYNDNIDKDDILNGKSCYSKWYLVVKYIIDIKGKDYFFKMFKDKELFKDEISKLLVEINKYYHNLEKLQIDNELFKLYSPDSLKYITDSMIKILNDKIKEYIRIFNITDFEKVQINYFDDKDKFRNFIYSLRGENTLPEYAQGTFDNDMINAYIPNNLDINSISYKRRLYMSSHELFHILYRKNILEKYNMKRIVWYDEGMAQFLSGEFDYLNDKNEFNIFLNEVKENTLEIPNLNNLKHGSDFENEKYSGYKLSYLAIRYLHEILSEKEFFDLMKKENDIIGLGNNIVNEIFDYYINRSKK